MKFLITGANGFIGSNVVEKLLKEGHQVRAMILEGTDESNIDEFQDKIEKFYGDITKPETLTNFQDIEVVVHLAAYLSDWGPDKIFQKINYEGTKNVLDAAIDLGVKRFVFMSSLAVHGFKNFENADEETPYKPYNAYARSKRAVEDLLNEYDSQGKIEIVIIRPGYTIFGPKDRLFSYTVYEQLENGKIYGAINKGKAFTCYSYVENLVDGIILVSTHPKAAGQTYIITDGPIIRWKEFNEKLVAPFELDQEKKAKLSSAPFWLMYIFVGLLEGIYKLFRRKKGPILTLYRIRVQANNLSYVNNKIVKELGYEPKIGLEEAFQRTYDWYKRESSKNE